VFSKLYQGVCVSLKSLKLNLFIPVDTLYASLDIVPVSRQLKKTTASTLEEEEKYWEWEK